MHYDSFSAALKKWDERKNRIQWDNIYIVNDCTNDKFQNIITTKMIEDFNKIPYPKIIFCKRGFGFNYEHILKQGKNGFPSSVLDKKKNSYKYGFNQFNFNKFLRKKCKDW